MGEEVALKREVGWFGSFSLGYADVGADIFIALGLIASYAAGATPFVFLFTSIIYVSIGLVYAELAPTYPYAGGVQVYALKAFNDLTAFVAGWALIMSYTLCITLFALAAAGYLLYLFPTLAQLLGLAGLPPLGVLAALLTLGLILVNYVGIKYSVGVLMALVVLGLLLQGLVLAAGYLLVFNPSTLLGQLSQLGSPKVLEEVGYLPGLGVEFQNLLYALTLAMASFIGIESIAQAAEETKRPARWIPRAAKLSVAAVLASVLGFSVLALGAMSWEELARELENPIASLVSLYPGMGSWAALVVAFAGFVLCYASSNTGVIGVSRLVASMGRFRLLPSWFYQIHPRFRTPTRSIVVFGVLGLVLAFTGDIPLVADLYNFGALLSYLILMLAFIKLRNMEEDVYRPWTAPGKLTLRLGNHVLVLPVIGLVGAIGVGALLLLTFLLHPAGRTFGLIWVAVGFTIHLLYRKRMGDRLVSRELAGEIAPISYVYDVGVLVRPMEEEEKAVNSITRALDRRFRITLMSVLEPSTFNLDPSRLGDSIQLESMKREAERDLEEIARRLRKRGYSVGVKVVVGDLEKTVSSLLDSGRLDFVALIRRASEKGKAEKAPEDRLRKVISRYPGRIMVLRRV